jgi:hypothetical protein
MSGSPVKTSMVWTPAPEMAKSIVPPPALSASSIACRREPAPESFVLATMKTLAATRVF